MKILVCGGRNFNDLDYVTKILDQEPRLEAIIQGGATGADTLAAIYGRANGIPVIEVAPNWQFYGKGAGIKRNCWMLEYCKPDKVIAFPGGNGTAHMVRTAKTKGIEVVECSP